VLTQPTPEPTPVEASSPVIPDIIDTEKEELCDADKELCELTMKKHSEVGKMLKVCDKDSSVCKLVLEEDAPLEKEGCELEDITILNADSEAIREEALVCSLNPEEDKDPIDFSSVIAKDPLPAFVRHPSEARSIKFIEKNPETFTVCDAENETCKELPFDQLPQTCELQEIEIMDKEGNKITKTVLVCDKEDMDLQKKIDEYRGNPETRHKFFGDQPEHSHADGKVCPLCGAAPQYQTLVWSLP
jgi:hypothetical protein